MNKPRSTQIILQMSNTVWRVLIDIKYLNLTGPKFQTWAQKKVQERKEMWLKVPVECKLVLKWRQLKYESKIDVSSYS